MNPTIYAIYLVDKSCVRQQVLADLTKPWCRLGG